jgi:hypothetical protein
LIKEGQTLKHWEQRLANIEQNQLAILKVIQQLNPFKMASTVPDFISIGNAAKKYQTTRGTIYTKIKLFESAKGREIDRLRKGAFNLVNEFELLEAMRLKSPIPEIFKKKKPNC